MVDGDHRVAIVANRDMAGGEELFYNYHYDKRARSLGFGVVLVWFGGVWFRVDCGFSRRQQSVADSFSLLFPNADCPAAAPTLRTAGGARLGGGRAGGGRAAAGGREKQPQAPGQPRRRQRRQRRQRPRVTQGRCLLCYFSAAYKTSRLQHAIARTSGKIKWCQTLADLSAAAPVAAPRRRCMPFPLQGQLEARPGLASWKPPHAWPHASLKPEWMATTPKVRFS